MTLIYEGIGGGVCLETRLDPTPLVTAEEVFCLGVLEGTAGNEIDPYQDHNRHYKDYIGFSPFFS